MTVEQWLNFAHEEHLRDHLEKPMEPWNAYSVAQVHEPALLPDAERKSMVPECPVPAEDLSYLNPTSWERRQRLGRLKKPYNRREARRARAVIKETSICSKPDTE